MTVSGSGAATLRRRAGLLARLLGHPAELWLALRMAGWRLVLPVLKHRMALPRLARMMWREPRAAAAIPALEARIATLAGVVFRSEHGTKHGNCLERSLVLYRYLAAAGADPELRVGLRRPEAALRGHAWVTVRGTALGEPPGSLEGFGEVVTFGRRGDRTSASHGVPSVIA
ncbi:MAG: lasso peptide biosynthesis B2 protein [Egibacteraceae bacterium]